ncbi:MAG TPA: glycosyltransferase family 2 protein [Fimbriimonadaceae bacterium]|nr:glycosyltransferase family 2 protein [Fimbriimonadaceae bacterium]
MLSILIVSWNTRDLLQACLASIRRFPPREPLQVIVVDNASSDGSAELVRQEFPEVRLLPQERNLGYAAGNNAAFSVADGEWLLTLNPDTEVYEDTLESALRKLREHTRFGALGARQIGVDGGTQRSVRGFPGVLGILGDLTALSRLFPKSPLGSYSLRAFDYEREGPAPQPMGTFLLFRKEALAAVGDPKRPFDEAFPIFFNEVDLLYRLKKAGWPCLYSPDVRVKHYGGESTKQVRKSMIWESHRSLLRFFRKHASSPAGRFAMPFLAAAVYAGALIRARGYHAGFGA